MEAFLVEIEVVVLLVVVPRVLGDDTVVVMVVVVVGMVCKTSLSNVSSADRTESFLAIRGGGGDKSFVVFGSA